jgi:hypothetical protein
VSDDNEILDELYEPGDGSEQPAAATDDAGTDLSGLMATDVGERDLEGEALRAAELALAEGERALAAARAQLQQNSPTQGRRPRRGRQIALRVLLAVNVLAMVVIASLPAPATKAKPDEPPVEAPPQPVVPIQPPVAATRYNEPWNRAMQAAEDRDFARAVTILEGYLADNPRMVASQKLSVLMALSHYSARIGTSESIRASQDYQRRADAIEQSHSLPEDLVAMAQAAAENGDQEALRRVWARFLLQQRQIPSWLYKHVAQAYLELGDSYRREADAAAEQARLRDLQETAARLRAEAMEPKEKR